MFGKKNMLDAPCESWHPERYGKFTPINKENAAFMLRTIKNVFEEHDIVFMLSYGTLLGAIREHDFIAHDEDVDTMIWGRDLQKALEIVPELEKYGVQLYCYYLPWIFTFEYKGETCDVEVLYEAIWPWNIRYCLTHEMYIPKKLFEKTERIEFLGEMFSVPANPEKVLVYHYGKDWRIPKGGSGRIESYVFFWRYAHRFLQRCKRYAKKHWFKK